MHTTLYTHPVCLEHDTGPHHPECADRLKAVLAVLEGENFTFLHRAIAPHATREQLLRVHHMAHVDQVMNALPHGDGWHHLDPDTVISAHSGEAALRAAGAVCAAVDDVAAGRSRNAFCAVRPPGHHAESDQAMGFCLFNNVAIGALHAREVHGVKRVAVIDFDVHHGNGTQHIFEDDPDLFYGSTHEAHAYPNTGMPEERGIDGNVVNAPLAAGTGSASFREAMADAVLPALRAFEPGFILISAGFDAHSSDPLANLRLTTEDFAWVTREILKVADQTCSGRVVSVLEGGYDLRALAYACSAHVQALMAG